VPGTDFNRIVFKLDVAAGTGKIDYLYLWAVSPILSDL
jgi:hypothetical protein